MMTVKELIEQLEKMPQELRVCIFDWQENEKDSDEVSAAGIYSDFEITHMGEDDIADNSPEWVALSFVREE